MKIKGEIKIEGYTPQGVKVSITSEEMGGRGLFTVFGVDSEKDFESPIPFEFELKEREEIKPEKKTTKNKDKE